MTTITQRLDEQLDRAQDKLPPALAAPLRLQRTIAHRGAQAASAAAASLWDSARNVKAAQARAYNTVAGTIRWAAATSARAGRTVKGQAAAQTRQFGRTAREEFADLSDSVGDAVDDLGSTAVDVIDAVDTAIGAESGATNEAYEDLTKDELYRRAKALDIQGRSQMTKDELISAVSDAA